MVNVIGVRTFDTVPGLNRHRRNALVAALSKIGLPVLCAISALVTEPLPGSTVITHTPLPVTLERRASYGYSGRGALMATAFAEDIDIGPTGPTGFGLARGTTGALLGVRFGGGVGFSSTNSGCCSGMASGGGGGGGSSSGGGVGCGGSCWVSSDISTVASGISERSTTFSAGRIAAIATAVKWSAMAPPKAAMACHRGAGR